MKNTRKNPNLVARDKVKIPVGFIKFHNGVFLTRDIFFVNKITFLLTLSRKTYFRSVNHLANHTVTEIFKAFKEVYHYYLHCGFRITIVHSDGEFRPLKIPIEYLPGGPLVNMAVSNEHIPDIKR